MKNKQDNLYFGDTLYKIFLKANDIKNALDDVVISTEHLIYSFTYDNEYGFQILNQKDIPEFLETIKKMKSDPSVKNDFNTSNESLDKYGIDLTQSARDGVLDPVIGRDEEIILFSIFLIFTLFFFKIFFVRLSSFISTNNKLSESTFC